MTRPPGRNPGSRAQHKSPREASTATATATATTAGASRALTAFAAAAAIAAAPQAHAQAQEQQQPLWELGIGAAGIDVPHYRGSDQRHAWLLPVPYAVYRGKILKADRNGARAVLFNSDRIDVDLSLAAGPPTRSDDNEARRGMHDLAPTVELGPNVNFTLAKGSNWKLDLRAPLRAAITLESQPRHIGWVASPNLNLDVARVQGWNMGLQAGALFGSRKANAYYYDVSAADATARRPAYRASGGAAGYQLTAAMSRRFANTWAGFFVRYDSLEGARFADSPLVRRRDNVSVGFAVSWVLARSSRTVSASAAD